MNFAHPSPQSSRTPSLDLDACYTAGMTIAALALAASLGYVPGDGFVSVRMTLVPQSCHVVFVDEGVRIDAKYIGPGSYDLAIEARDMVADDPIENPGTALQQCLRAAQTACPNGIKSLEVTPTTCRFECYPPPITPTNPPPASPTGPMR